MKKLIALFVVCLALQACQTPPHELKSPCVGAEGSPCGQRINVNDWWMNTERA